jgi:hypothetical protein
MLYNSVRGHSWLLERYAYAMNYDYAHPFGCAAQRRFTILEEDRWQSTASVSA